MVSGRTTTTSKVAALGMMKKLVVLHTNNHVVHKHLRQIKDTDSPGAPGNDDLCHDFLLFSTTFHDFYLLSTTFTCCRDMPFLALLWVCVCVYLYLYLLPKAS